MSRKAPLTTRANSSGVMMSEALSLCIEDHKYGMRLYFTSIYCKFMNRITYSRDNAELLINIFMGVANRKAAQGDLSASAHK